VAESNLIKRGEHVWTGAAGDAGEGMVVVDVRDLPESPASYKDIPLAKVVSRVKRIDSAVAQEKDVLVRCAHGVSRSPTIAKLALSGQGRSFSATKYFPNEAWAAFARMYANYFKERKYE
jgi:protein-tyrosine phosphatase